VKLFHRKATNTTEPPREPNLAPGADATNGSTGKPVKVQVVEPASETAVVPAAAPAPAGTVDRFNRLFDHWMLVPFPDWPTEIMHVQHFRDGDTFVVRAELRGLDPDKDVELTVSDGALWIEGRHRDQNRSEEHGFVRHEVRYGAFSRSFPLPGGVTAADIDAKYKDGVLDIRIPAPEHHNVARVPITKS
jgi:HSP20 family protein